MVQTTFKFSNASTDFYFDSSFSQLQSITNKASAIIVTDENVFNAHKNKFKGYNCIVLKPGEEFKIQATVDSIVDTLIKMQADRKSVLIGVGGGVITDLTGYVASVYMRGIRFGFVPTSILALVDASIGGKNGIDVGVYKNLVGIIRQPSFIVHDVSLLQSLPQSEWENGFAEIIKHACIKDVSMFKQLQNASLQDFMKNKAMLTELIKRNALIKIRVVKKDEFEKGDRRLLNFGHTLGHAIETQYELLHGQAISIGMTYACHISEQLTGFDKTEQVVNLLEKYNLPTYAAFDKEKVFEVLKMDKKRIKKEMNFVLLDKIGKAVVQAVDLKKLEKMIQKL